ncbi:MAG: hypothetical protein BGO29_12175 [Bacteroidales bacterium 36-12]|nr:MAG: hypothetical protein BGO29_12175 [Bacteroidales bacterium 36-12]
MKSLKNKCYCQLLQSGKLFVLLSIIVALNLPVKAQFDIEKGIGNYYPDDTRQGFNSIFKDFPTGDFSGTLSGVLFSSKGWFE